MVTLMMYCPESLNINPNLKISAFIRVGVAFVDVLSLTSLHETYRPYELIDLHAY